MQCNASPLEGWTCFDSPAESFRSWSGSVIIAILRRLFLSKQPHHPLTPLSARKLGFRFSSSFSLSPLLSLWLLIPKKRSWLRVHWSVYNWMWAGNSELGNTRSRNASPFSRRERAAPALSSRTPQFAINARVHPHPENHQPLQLL